MRASGEARVRSRLYDKAQQGINYRTRSLLGVRSVNFPASGPFEPKDSRTFTLHWARRAGRSRTKAPTSPVRDHESHTPLRLLLSLSEALVSGAAGRSFFLHSPNDRGFLAAGAVATLAEKADSGNGSPTLSTVGERLGGLIVDGRLDDARELMDAGGVGSYVIPPWVEVLRLGGAMRLVRGWNDFWIVEADARDEVDADEMVRMRAWWRGELGEAGVGVASGGGERGGTTERLGVGFRQQASDQGWGPSAHLGRGSAAGSSAAGTLECRGEVRGNKVWYTTSTARPSVIFARVVGETKLCGRTPLIFCSQVRKSRQGPADAMHRTTPEIHFSLQIKLNIFDVSHSVLLLLLQELHEPTATHGPVALHRRAALDLQLTNALRHGQVLAQRERLEQCCFLS